jgi:hypothetical protein
MPDVRKQVCLSRYSFLKKPLSIHQEKFWISFAWQADTADHSKHTLQTTEKSCGYVFPAAVTGLYLYNGASRKTQHETAQYR